MQPNHNTKIGILFLLFLIITILFYTQYLASNSNNQSLSTSAKTYNQSPAPTCAPPPRRCPQGGTCNAQSKTCVTLSPTGSQPPTVVPNTSSPGLTPPSGDNKSVTVRYEGYEYYSNNNTYQPFFQLVVDKNLETGIIGQYQLSLLDFPFADKKDGFFITATSSKNDQTGLVFDQRGEYLLKSPGARNITGPIDTFYIYIYKFPSLEIARSVFQNAAELDQKVRDYLLKIEKMDVSIYKTIQRISYYDDRRLDGYCPSPDFKYGDIIIEKGWFNAGTSLTCMSCNKKINPYGKDKAVISQSACNKMIQYDDYKTRCSTTSYDQLQGKNDRGYFTFTGSDNIKRCFQCSSAVYTGPGEFIGPVNMNYCKSIYHGP